MTETGAARRTPFYETHLSLGARMIEFFGWEMPVQYSGIVAEHRCVRQKAGIFDLSHMGEFDVRGPGANEYLQRLLTNNVDRAGDGKALYSAICNEDGGVLDDLLVYRRANDDYLVVVNASNIEKDFAWFQQHLADFAKSGKGVELVNRSYDVALVAVQGPTAKQIVAPLVTTPVDDLYYYEFRDDAIAGQPVTLARTGYTGEDGFEVYVENANAQLVWDALWEAGEPLGMLPVGLGARDTLRLEMGYALYGHELTETVNPIEAGIGWVVSAKKTFIGSDVVLPLKETGARRVLRGLKLDGKGVPRQHCPVNAGGKRVGEVTSGTVSPSLGEPIALALIELEALERPLSIEIRGRDVPASLTDVPFVPSNVYRRPKPR
jgi:aminomethyltransferase